MQIPSRTLRATCLGSEGAPTAGAAVTSTAATRAMTATYSSEAWPAVGDGRTPPLGPRAQTSPPNFLEQAGEGGARVAGDVEERLRVHPEDDRGGRAHDGHEDHL